MLQAVSGGVIFAEFARFTGMQAIEFAAGVAVLLFGVYQLSRGHMDNDSGEISQLGVSAQSEIPKDVRKTEARPPHKLWRHSRMRAVSAVVVQQKLDMVRHLRAGS